MKTQPDIVIVVLDTQRVDRLSCYGYEKATSPHLDELAADATRYTQAISPAHWTLPAHVSMMTGLYPTQHTVTQYTSVLPDKIPTLAERLRKAGYFNVLLSNNPFIGAMNNGVRRGFDRVANYSYIGSGLWTSKFQPPPKSKGYWAQFRYQVRRLLSQTLGLNADSHPTWWSTAMMTLVESLLHFRGGSKFYDTQHTMHAAADVLIRRRKLHRADQPIFTFINLMATHIPYAPPRWAMERFVFPELGSRSWREVIHSSNAFGLDVMNWFHTAAPFDECQSRLSGFYDAEVYAQDTQVGYFLAQLRQAGILDDTLLIVVADHGEHLGEKQRVNHSYGAYQPLAHVPLIIRGPRQGFAAKTDDRFISTRRIFHTVLQAAGAAQPEEQSLGLTAEGAEALPVVCEAEPSTWILERLARATQDAERLAKSRQYIRALYAGEHKLIANAYDPHERYAVRRDPQELQELSAADADTATKMQEMLKVFDDSIQKPQDGQVFAQEQDPAVLQRLKDLGYW